MECFNCGDSAAERFSLVFDSGTVVRDRPVCAGCLSNFREEEWIAVHEGSVHMRGGDDEED